MPESATARAPEGLRLYAIGDVHGRLDLLRDMHQRIAGDLVSRPCPRHRVIHLGDYIDRGPDSAGVVDFLLARLQEGHSACLAGNHDLFVPAFLRDPHDVGEPWLRYGGTAALASWGMDMEAPGLRNRPLPILRDALDAALPDSHRAFFAALSFMERHGDYVFVHAGVRPGVPIGKQRIADLTMIREPFLSHEGDFGAVVVHGHTVIAQPAFRHNRIGIDTGAYRSGVLSCAVLEGATQGLLMPGGYLPKRAPSR